MIWGLMAAVAIPGQIIRVLRDFGLRGVRVDWRPPAGTPMFRVEKTPARVAQDAERQARRAQH